MDSKERLIKAIKNRKQAQDKMSVVFNSDAMQEYERLITEQMEALIEFMCEKINPAMYVAKRQVITDTVNEVRKILTDE